MIVFRTRAPVVSDPRGVRVRAVVTVVWSLALLGALALPATAVCVGDCDNDGHVTIDELLRGANIALGGEDALCATFDVDSSGQVTIDELLTAVTHALDGCPMPLLPAPPLESSDPADGASNVVRTAWLRLDFESVVDPTTLQGFRLTCGRALRPLSAHAVSATTVVINPVGDLPPSTPCALSWQGPEATEVLEFSTAATGAPASVVYDRTLATLIPFPDDIFTATDASKPTGIRLELPSNALGLLRIFFREGNRLDGFSPVAHFVIETSDPADPSSLPQTAIESLDPLATAGLFDLDPASPTFAQRVPFRLDVRTDTNVSDVTSHSILIFPSIPLAPGGRYGFVLTRRARVDAQRPLDPSFFFREALDDAVPGEPTAVTRVRALAGDVLEVLEHATPPIPADDVALALRISVRTTDDIPTDLLAIKEDLLAGPAPGYVIDSVESGTPFGVDVAAIVKGRWEAPDFRGGDTLYFERGSDGRPMRTRTQSVPFILALPRAALDGPVPIVMYQHGNPGSAQDEVPRHAGRSLAGAGLALIGFTDNLNREVSLGMGTDDEQVAAQVTAVFFALVNNRRVPDYWMETSAEQLAFVRLIENLGTLDVLPIGAPDGVPDLDVDAPLSYVGISEGANHAPRFLTYAPEIRAAALVVGGGRLAETLIHQAAETFLTQLGPIDPTLSAPGIWVGLSLFQTIFDRQDSHNHGRFIYRQPLEVAGTTRKASILLVEGLEDSLVPNNATDSMAWQIGPLPHLNPVQRAVPFLEVLLHGPVIANIDTQTTAAFFQYVPVGVSGIDPTPGCLDLSPTSANEGHFCAQGARESLRQRVVFFTTAVKDDVPTIIDPFSDTSGGGAAIDSSAGEFQPAR